MPLPAGLPPADLHRPDPAPLAKAILFDPATMACASVSAWRTLR